MKTRLLVLSLATVCLGAASASAAMFDGTATGGDALQDLLDDLTEVTIANPSGDSSIDVYNDDLTDYADSYWYNSLAGSVSTMIFEVAGFASTNEFGIYDQADETNFLLLFDGDSTPGATTTVFVEPDGDVWVGAYSGAPDATFDGITYGFYLDSSAEATGGLWYSDSDLNSNSEDHMYAYQGEGDTMDLPVWGSSEIGSSYFLLVWEDLDGSVSDWDYTDMGILVESILPVPVPAAVLLGMLGLGVVGLKLRKYA